MEFHENDQKWAEIEQISDQKWAALCRNMQNLHESARNCRFCAGNEQRPAEAASGPSPAGPACPSRNIAKSLIFLGFLRGAASRGSGQPRPCSRARQRLAGMGQNVQKSRRNCRFLQKSAKTARICFRIVTKMSRNWSEMTRIDQNWQNDQIID